MTRRRLKLHLVKPDALTVDDVVRLYRKLTGDQSPLTPADIAELLEILNEKDENKEG